jgi:hypothetical protein
VSTWQRPQLPDLTAVDEHGAAFTYGRRWVDGPSDDAYSRTSHLERFAPLHDVARALVAHLVETYEVEVEPVDRVGRPDAVAQPVVEGWRLTPAPGQAVVTIGLTDFPGVMVETGLLGSAGVPHCGCDACDESAEGSADSFEQTVFDAVLGPFREWSRPSRDRSGGWVTGSETGSGWGEAQLELANVERDTLERAAGLPARWEPWTRRDAGEAGRAS